MGTEPERYNIRDIARRSIAGLLVVAMLGSTLLYRRTEVNFDFSAYTNRGAQVAIQQLMANDSYANAPRLTRMSTYLRSMLSGDRSFSGCEMAAQIAIARAEYDSAISYTEKAIELYEGDWDGLASLNLRIGYLYTLQNDYKNALKWLNRGLEIREDPEARLARAQVRLNLGDARGAVTDVERCLQETSINSQMLPNIVNIYEAAGEHEKAADCYSQLISLAGEPDYYLYRAYCYVGMGRMQEAAEDCLNYSRLRNQQTGETYAMLGIGWMRAGKYREAVDCFIKALNGGYSDSNSLYYYIVLCSYVNEDYSEASRYGDIVLEQINKGVRFDTADVQMEKTTGKLHVTLTELDIPSLSLMTGASHMRMEQYESAISSLTTCLETGSNPFAYYLRGSCFLASGRYLEAIPDFEKAIDAGEEVERCIYGRAVCRMQTGDDEGAMDDFDWVLLHGTDDSLFDETSRLMKEITAKKTDNGK